MNTPKPDPLCPICSKPMCRDDVVCSSSCAETFREEVLAAARPPLSVGEWLACSLSRVRGLHNRNNRRHALLADGTRISIQASPEHYCTPLSAFGPYTHVEVSHDGPPAWAPYREPDGGVYGWLPTEFLEVWCSEHGGIVGACVVEGSTELLLAAAGVTDLDELLPREVKAIELLADWDPDVVDALCFALTRQRAIQLRRVTDKAAATGLRVPPKVLKTDALLAGATPREIQYAAMRGITRHFRSSL